MSWKSYRVGRRSLHWPTVEGEIIASEVIKRKRGVGSPGRRGGMKDEWLAHIVYEYYLEREKYVSTQIKVFPTSWGSETAAQKLVDKYMTDRRVIVYHHPSVFEVPKVIDDKGKFFSRFQPDYSTALNGMEFYNPVSSPAQTLMIGGKYTKDAKFGNAVLEPGVNLKHLLLFLVFGASFTVLGLFFLVSQLTGS